MSTSTGVTTTTTTTTSGTASTGSMSSTSSGANEDNVAIGCTGDGDCGPGLKCSTADGTSTVFGGGPANGYCSKDCTTDDDCPGNTSTCFGAANGKPGLCLLTCDIGPALMNINEPLDPEKCRGREDLRCGPVNSNGTITACIPTCGRDDQCPANHFCDPRIEVCVTKPNTGLPIGSKCDPKATTPQCAGSCVSFSSGETTCSSPCVLGGDFTDLTAVADCGGLDKGICAYSPKGNGAGDYGICAAACKAHDECQAPAFWCGNVGLPDNGYCFGATACPNGTGCTNGDKCLDTKYGKYCLDASYPLGDTAPVGTSSSSGSGSSSASSSSASSSSASSSSASSSSASGSSTSGAGGGSSSSSSTASGVGGATSTASTGP